MTPRKPKNILARRTAVISYAVGGLSITVSDIPAVDAVRASAAMLRAARTLPARFPELVDGVSLHGGVVESLDEDDPPEGTDPITMRPAIGFVK